MCFLAKGALIEFWVAFVCDLSDFPHTCCVCQASFTNKTICLNIEFIFYL